MPANDTTRFAWIDTPDPKRRGFSITIPDANLEVEDLNAWQINVSTWADMDKVMRAERIRPSLHHYVYTLSRQAGGGTRSFYFFPPFTEDDKNTPFRVTNDTQQHTWPAVLERLVFAEDYSLPQLSKRDGIEVELPTILPQILFRDAYTADCEVTVREYLSSTPWPRYRLKHRKPVPTSVFWTFQGQQVGSFPECLHPEVNPNLDGYSEYLNPLFGAGTHNGILPSFDFAFRIPATNFTNWRDYIIQDKVIITETNLYYRRQVEVHVPDYLPSRISRTL